MKKLPTSAKKHKDLRRRRTKVWDYHSEGGGILYREFIRSKKKKAQAVKKQEPINYAVPQN